MRGKIKKSEECEECFIEPSLSFFSEVSFFASLTSTGITAGTLYSKWVESSLGDHIFSLNLTSLQPGHC